MLREQVNYADEFPEPMQRALHARFPPRPLAEFALQCPRFAARSALDASQPRLLRLVVTINESEREHDERDGGEAPAEMSIKSVAVAPLCLSSNRHASRACTLEAYALKFFNMDPAIPRMPLLLRVSFGRAMRRKGAPELVAAKRKILLPWPMWNKWSSSLPRLSNSLAKSDFA